MQDDQEEVEDDVESDPDEASPWHPFVFELEPFHACLYLLMSNGHQMSFNQFTYWSAEPSLCLECAKCGFLYAYSV